MVMGQASLFPSQEKKISPPSEVPYFLRPVAGEAPQRLTVTAKRFPTVAIIAAVAVAGFFAYRYFKRSR